MSDPRTTAFHIPTVIEAEKDALQSIDTGANAARDFLHTSQEALDSKTSALLAEKAVVDTSQPEVETHLNSMSTALSNLSKQGENPKVFNKFMSLFDSSYSHDKATAQIQQAQGGLTIVGKRLQAQEERTKLATETADTSLEGARLNYAIANDTVTKNIQKFGTVIQGNEAQMKQSRDNVERMSDAQLMTAIKSNKADGLMQQEFTRRKMQEAQLEEFTSRAGLQNQERDIKQKKILLEGFSSTERQHMLDASANTGVFTIANPNDATKKLSFTRKDILDVQNDYQKSEDANVTSRNEQRAQMTGVQSGAAMNTIYKDTMIRMVGALPADVEAKSNEYKAQADGATQAGDLPGLKAVVDGQQSFMKKQIDDIIAKAPEPTRESLNDFSRNGRHTDAQAASKSLAYRLSTGTSDVAMLPMVGVVGNSLQMKFGKIRDSQHSFAPVSASGAPIEIPETNIKNDEILRRAINDSAVMPNGMKYPDVTDPFTGVSQKYTDKNLLRDTFAEHYLRQTLKSLKDSPGFLDARGDNILVDDTGNIRKEFLNQNGALDPEGMIMKIYQYDADTQKATGVPANHVRPLIQTLMQEGRMKNGLYGPVGIDQYVNQFLYTADPRQSEIFASLYGANDNELTMQIKRRLSALDLPQEAIKEQLFAREQQKRFVDPNTGLGVYIDPTQRVDPLSGEPRK